MFILFEQIKPFEGQMFNLTLIILWSNRQRNFIFTINVDITQWLSGFYTNKLEDISNNANIDIRGFTTWKQKNPMKM